EGEVTSSDGKIKCRGSCVSTYTKDSVIALTAKADNWSRFSRWSTNCKDGIVNLNVNKECVVTFIGDVCRDIDSKVKWNKFYLPAEFSRITRIDGTWSINPTKFPPVGPNGYTEGKFVSQIRKEYTYSIHTLIDERYPIGSLLMVTDNTGKVLFPDYQTKTTLITGPTKLKDPATIIWMNINGQEFENHDGFLTVCFGD